MAERTYYSAQYNSLTHLPLSARMEKELPSVGQIYRVPLQCDHLLATEDIKVPDFIVEATRNHETRRGLDTALLLNSSRTPYPWLGKADSCFVALVSVEQCPTFVLDILIEEGHHARNGDPILHEYLRTHYNYAEAMPIGNNESVKNCHALSGHVAPVQISTREASHVIMLDAFRGEDVYDKSCPEVQILFKVLYSNRIVPLTAKCHPIAPR